MIPTSLAGFAEIHKRFCSMPWKELLAPAIAQAKLGTKVNTALETFYQKPMPGTTITGEERVLATASCTKAFLKPDKSLYYVGDTIPLNDLANTLDIIANKGVDEFYRGDIARAIAQDMESNNGFVTLKDLQSYKPKIAEPLWGSYHGTGWVCATDKMVMISPTVMPGTSSLRRMPRRTNSQRGRPVRRRSSTRRAN